jgi:hypothetical protein
MNPHLRSAASIALGALLAFGLATVSTPPWSPAALTAGVYALAALLAVAFLIRPWRPVFHPLLIPLAGCAAWGAIEIGFGWSTNPFATRAQSFVWGSRLALAAIALQIFSEQRWRDAFLRGLLYGGAAWSVFSLTQFYTSQGRIFWLINTPYGEPVLGSFLNRDHYAALVELFLPLAIWQAWTARRHAWFFFGVVAVAFASVLAGASRAGVAAALAEIVVVSLLASWRRAAAGAPWALRQGIVLAASLLLAGAVVGGGLLWSRLGEQDPLRVRRDFLASSLEMIGQHPWTGAGLGTWPDVYPAFARIDPGTFANHAHNDWAEWAADGGLPFLALLLWLVAIMTRAALSRPWALGLAAVAGHSLLDYPLQQAALWLVWVTLAAALAADSRPGAGLAVRSESPEL